VRLILSESNYMSSSYGNDSTVIQTLSASSGLRVETLCTVHWVLEPYPESLSARIAESRYVEIFQGNHASTLWHAGKVGNGPLCWSTYIRDRNHECTLPPP
jgi:hypothetical protein